MMRMSKDFGLSREQIAELCGRSKKRGSFWNGKRVLVTGASGLLGSWMTHALVEAGARVHVLIRDWVTESLLFADDTLERVTAIQGDLCQYDLIERLLFDYEITHLFHLGAQTQVRTANRLPRDTFESNIRGTWNILEASRVSPTTQAVVFASSDKAYGSQEELPYTEETPLQGEHPYDVSKSCADLLAQAYYKSYALPICITRCGNLYGPGDLNYDRIIPGTIRSVVRSEQPVIRSDGTYTRDYLFVPDAVDGYLTVAENMGCEGILGQAFNLSTGNKITVSELFEMLIKELGAEVTPKILNEAGNEIKEQSLSYKKASRLLSWKPRHSIGEGLRVTVPWYVRQLQQ